MPSPRPLTPPRQRIVSRQAPTPTHTSPRSPSKPLTLRFTDHPRPDIPSLPLAPETLTLVEGHAGTEAMRQRLILDSAQEGRTVLQITGGNRLDSTGLARRAQAHGLDPTYVLHASLLARGFTAYQLSVLLERLPTLLTEEPSIAAVLVLDPLALYTDEDVRPEEGTCLTQQAVEALEAVASEHACPIVIVQPRRPAWSPSPGRRGQASGPSSTHLAKLRGLLRCTADERVRVVRQGTSIGTDGRVIELPRRGRRVRVAKARFEQARLDRFAQEVDARG